MNPKLVFKNKVDLDTINAQMLPNQLAGHLGIRFVEITDNSASAALTVCEKHARPGGLMSGGTSLALIETVASVAGMLTLDISTHNVFGIEVSANHVSQVKMGETITALATPDHLGRTTQVWSVRITSSQNDKLVCIGRITLFVTELPKA